MLSKEKHPLIELIEQGEHSQLDFKYEINDPAKIAITLSAFANTKGGKLLVGVKDNGKIKGINPEEEFHVFVHAAKNYCFPEVNFTTKNWKIENVYILEFTVEMAKDKPVYAIDKEGKKWAYVRLYDQNILAHLVMLEIWKQDKMEDDFWLDFKSSKTNIIRYLNDNSPASLGMISRHLKQNLHLTKMQVAYLIRWNLACFELFNQKFYISNELLNDRNDKTQLYYEQFH